MRALRLAAAAALLSAPMAAWALFKPMRVVAPELAGLECPSAGICIDDPSRLDEAERLKSQTVEFVESKLGRFDKVPRVVFCSIQACAKSFGFTDEAGYNVGASGFAISPRGWKDFYLRHELIHHTQMERLGVWRATLKTPTWLIEGMAYSVSGDPRRPLPPTLEAYRSRFDEWRAGVPDKALWQAAKAL